MSTNPEAPGDQLEESHVTVLYQALLGRDAAPGEVEHHLTHSRTARTLLDVIFASAEYGARNPPGDPGTTAPDPFVANLWHPDLAAWTHAPGTRSDDDVAIVGNEGWIFMRGGSNHYAAQYTGELAMAPDWLPGWQDLVARRAQEADALGCRLATMVVPEKVAILPEHYPEPLVPRGPRPVERLLGAGVPLCYPLDELRHAQRRHNVCLRTDSHLTMHGNWALSRPLLRDLGAEPMAFEELPAGDEYLACGDLGSRFAPRILEVSRTPLSMGRATLTQDNWDAIRRTGGHIGTCRVYSSPDAPDPRTAVLFGDSYGFAAEAYQGTAWFLAQAFRETHFVWAPFGWDPGYVERVGAEVVVSETAERFMVRVPLERVDVGALAAEALARDTFVAVDEIYADAPPDAV